MNTLSNEVSIFSIIQGGLVLGCTLTWSEVIRSGANYIYPENKEKALEMQLLYAIILTIIVVLIFNFLQKTKDNLAEMDKQIQRKELELQKIKNSAKLFEYFKNLH